MNLDLQRVGFFSFALLICVLGTHQTQAQQHEVWITTDSYGKSLPGVRVTIGPGSVVTDAKGLGSIKIPLGTYKLEVESRCRVSTVYPGNGVTKSGPDANPTLTFRPDGASPLGYRVTILLSCSGPASPAPPAAGTCFDNDPGMVSLNPSMHREWARKQTREVIGDFRKPIDLHAKAIIENLSLKVNLLGECSTVTHEDLSFLLAQVSYLPPSNINVLSEPGFSGPTWESNNLRKNVEWARSQSRFAVLDEIKKRMGYRILYGHETADEAFVSMSLAIAGWYDHAAKRGRPQTGQARTGDSTGYFVKVGMPVAASQPVVKLRERRYTSEPIIVDYSNPSGSGRDYIIIVQPGRASGPHGSISKDYAWQIDPTANAPKAFSGSAMFPPLPDGGYEARYISVDPGGNGRAAASGSNPTSPGSGETGGTNSLVKPTKSVFSPGEAITVDYFNANGSGWDRVAIVQPSRINFGTGDNSSIDPRYSRHLDVSTNAYAERRGQFSFPPLPEGDYEARYISLAGGNNIPIFSAPFKVGNPPAAPPPNGPGPVASPPPATSRWDLTGLWRNPGGNGIYRVRQIGTKVVWGLDAISLGSIANMFQGQISGDSVDGVWEDLPGSPTIGGGRMLLKVESECRFVRVSSVNRYGADVWVRKDSLCDIVPQPQAAVSSAGAQPAAKPKVEEIPDDTAPPRTARNNPPVVVVGDPSGIFAKPPARTAPTSRNQPKPKVEEIPDEAVAVKPGKPMPKPKVEEIADDDIFVDSKPNAPAQSQPGPQPKPEKTPKPKKTGPGFWEKLGTAINQAATNMPQQQPQPQQPQQPPPSTGGAPQQPQGSDGKCQGGTVWLGTPVRTQSGGMQFPYSLPFDGPRNYSVHINHAGTDQAAVTYLFLRVHAKDTSVCGLSVVFYPKPGSYDAYVRISAADDWYKHGPVVYGPIRFNF